MRYIVEVSGEIPAEELRNEGIPRFIREDDVRILPESRSFWTKTTKDNLPDPDESVLVLLVPEDPNNEALKMDEDDDLTSTACFSHIVPESRRDMVECDEYGFASRITGYKAGFWAYLPML
jgi:hypothetical protein